MSDIGSTGVPRDGRLGVVLHPSHSPGVSDALARIPGIDLRVARDEEDVVEHLESGAEVLVTHLWSPEFLVEGLGWIQSHSAGLEQFPADELSRRSVMLTSASGAHPVVAEHAIALLLALTRRIAASRDDQSRQIWPGGGGVELGGSCVTVLGLGNIGRAVVDRLNGWDVELLGVTRRPGPAEHGLDQLTACLRRSQALIVCVAGGSATRGLVGRAELEALAGGYLVNVSRGSVVDEVALTDLLHAGRLAGAGLDVFVDEPLPATSPLWWLENVVITGHTAGTTQRYGEHLARIFASHLGRYQRASAKDGPP